MNLARESVHGAAKWYVAALGAIGAILLAGSQLSSLGALQEGTPRWWVAFGGVILGLLAVLWAVSSVVKILAGRPWTFEDAVRASGSRTPSWAKLCSGGISVGDWLSRNSSVLGGYATITEIQETYAAADPDDPQLAELLELMSNVREKTAAVDLSFRFRRLRLQIGVAMTIAALGILAFAWAANPGDKPPPSLRSADLSGADLRGASLRNADLTGARLTNANLRGANLEGARIGDTIWGNTTCPDGTNSDDVARPNSSGKLAGATCEGHLIP